MNDRKLEIVDVSLCGSVLDSTNFDHRPAPPARACVSYVRTPSRTLTESTCRRP